ncbi:hypothetical protein ACET3Z_030085 [Daucus carota]
MGKKIDALLGRTFNRTLKTYKFKPVVSLAISRLSVLKNQRQARMSVARSDVVGLLNLGHHDRALNRVEQVIKEQNMVDVFVIVEGYCHLFVERLDLVDKEKGCPEELEEAVSSLIYASTRCGEFPELQEMRAMFTSRFGKEFVARGAELRNNCKVNTKMVVKLSTRQPNLESRMKVLKAIASENGITLQIEEESSITIENFEAGSNLKENSSNSLEEKVESFSDSMKGRKKYKDVADAAQAAFESAAYAAAAARAAVELSRSGSYDPDDQNSPSTRSRKASNTPEPRFPSGRGLDREESEISNTYQSVYEDEDIQISNNDEGSKISFPYDSDHIPKGTEFHREIVFDGSDDEDGTEQRTISLTRIHDSEPNTVTDRNTSDGSDSEPTILHKQYPAPSQASPEWNPVPANPKFNYAEKPEAERSLQLNFDNRPMSMRTRRVYRQ